MSFNILKTGLDRFNYEASLLFNVSIMLLIKSESVDATLLLRKMFDYLYNKCNIFSYPLFKNILFAMLVDSWHIDAAEFIKEVELN